MNFIEILLSEKLKGRNPMLDVWGADRKVLQIACQDFANYLKVHWNLIGRKAGDCELAERLEKLYRQQPGELEEFAEIWAGSWLKKWAERVKLLVGKENCDRQLSFSDKLRRAEPLWRSLPNRRELQEAVIATLIRNGEICGTEVLAENLLKMELGEEPDRPVDDKEHILKVLGNVTRKARELARSRGPLIFVKIDKGYYGDNI